MSLYDHIVSFRDDELVALRNRNHTVMRAKQNFVERMQNIIDQMDDEIDRRGLSDQKVNE